MLNDEEKSIEDKLKDLERQVDVGIIFFAVIFFGELVYRFFRLLFKSKKSS